MKKRSKRVLAAVLCLVMGLTACGGGDSSADTSSKASESAEVKSNADEVKSEASAAGQQASGEVEVGG